MEAQRLSFADIKREKRLLATLTNASEEMAGGCATVANAAMGSPEEYKFRISLRTAFNYTVKDLL